MVAAEQTRIVLKELARAGWTRKRSGKGSHSIWQCPSGRHTEVVPDGHRTIRVGVVRSIRRKIANCNCRKES